MSRRKLLVMGLSFLVLVAACGGDDEGSETTEATGAASAAEPVEITVWVNSAESEALQALYPDYTEATGNPVEVVSFPSDGYETAILQRWAAGDRPDVLEWHGNFNWVAAINPAENLHDLSGEDFVARTLGGILDANASMNGVVYGTVLRSPTAFGFYYNKAVFDELGLTPPTTAEEVLATCKAIQEKDPSIVPILENAGSLWPPLTMHGGFMADAMQAGWAEQINAREAKVSDPDSAWLRANEFFVQLYDEGCFNDDVLTAQWESAAQSLVNGEAAMVSLHTGLVDSALDAVGIEEVNATIGWTPWSETRPIVTVETSPLGTYYVPKTGDADREAAALEFIRFVTGDRYAQYVEDAGLLPVFEGVPIPDGIPEPLLQVNEAIATYGSAVPVWSLLPGITDLVNYPAALLTGEHTPQTAVELLQVEAEQGAEEAGLPAWP